MEHVNDFTDLEVYRRAEEVWSEIFELSKAFPPEERYSLTDQIRRSSRSVGAQIAEAWAKRMYVRHFVSKLTDADGEQRETRHWLRVARQCQYLDVESFERLTQQLLSVGRMLGSMRSKAELFCSESLQIRESPVDDLDETQW